MGQVMDGLVTADADDEITVKSKKIFYHQFYITTFKHHNEFSTGA
jgi:hypothetical protein